VIDIVVKPLITEHSTIGVLCPQTGKQYQGEFPANITSTIQYGTELEALTISLNTIGAVSVNRTHDILSGVFGIPLSTGTISSMVKEGANAVRPTVKSIKEMLPGEKLIHFDETGTRVNGKTMWAHTASTKDMTYISVEENRGKKGMESAGVVQFFKGIGVHDCWAAYFSYAFISALCCAHLLRELTGVFENYSQKWAEDFINLLMSMKHEKERLIAKGKHSASKKTLEKYSKAYDEIVAAALEANPLPPKEPGKKTKKGKPRTLAERLSNRKAEYTLFFTNFNVPFDNNQAERDIRMFKVKQKVSGCFRTMDGADDYAVIMSYLNTARKRGLAAFAALRDALLGKPFGVMTE
jgi:transposase